MSYIVANSAVNLEIIEDDIAALLQAGPGITIVYDDPGDTLTISVNESEIDHGGLDGLGDDDHTQYALLAGRAGGQTLFGSPTSGENLTLRPNSAAANGKILLGTTGAYDESAVAFGIGTQTPLAQWHLSAGTGDILINGGTIGSTAADGFKLGVNLLSGVITFAQQENANVLFTRNAVDTMKFLAAETVFNDGGANLDFRVEGDTNANLIFVDASTDFVGIGLNSPTQRLMVSGNVATFGVADYFTSPGTGVQSEKFGATSSAAGDGSLAVGYGATAAASEGTTAIGHSATAAQIHATAVGYLANAGDEESTAIGYAASAQISGVAIGAGAIANNGAVAIGAGAQATDTNVLAIGPSTTVVGGLGIGPSISIAGNDFMVGSNITSAATNSGNLGLGNLLTFAGNNSGNIAIGVSNSFADGVFNVAVIGSAVVVPDTVNRSLVFSAGEGATIRSSLVMVVGGQVGSPIQSLILGNGEYWDNNYPDSGSNFTITPTYYIDREDTEGVNLTLDGGNGTGTGGSGKVIIRTAPPDATGSTQNTHVECFVADKNQNVAVGKASLATTATDGFPYIPTCAGVPTGTPTAITGFAPLVIDSSNNKLYAYIGGAWRIMN